VTITMLRNPGSQGARVLATAISAAMGVPVGLASVDSERRTRGDRIVLNWGVSQTPRFFRQRRLTSSNSAESVANCQDKRKTLVELMGKNVPHLQFALDAERTLAHEQTVKGWLEEDGKIIARLTTTGHSGSGIVVVRRGGNIPAAPLYTRYFRKHAEYRVHVAFGNVVLIQQKRKRNGFEQSEDQALIRVHGNGWVFTTQALSCDERNYRERLSALALAAADAVGAQHCAVDILANHTSGVEVVCEINSAPGIEAGSTKEAYTNAFVSWLKERT